MDLIGRRPEPSLQSGYVSIRDDFVSWDEYNVRRLRRSFTTTAVADEYEQRGLTRFVYELPAHQMFDYLRQDIEGQLRRLRSVDKQVEGGLFSDGPAVVAATESLNLGPRPPGQRVFIVHGHYNGLKLEVADFLKRATGKEPIILHLEASSGRTLIEKVEHYGSDAGFAVVLLTADDFGRAQDGVDRPRARQNVMFELGYFIGLFGRGHATALTEGGVEKPSDLDGLVYIPLSGHWKLDLARELRAAEIDMDLNKVG
jgi:predicted nucleotide-binding protein